MYAGYFGLSEAPFSISPDPRYLFMSRRHKEALAHLIYGIERGGGFALLSGEVGTGKTTLCRCLLTQIPKNIDVALILNPQISESELLATLCDELKVGYPADATAKAKLDLLNDHLLHAYSKGRGTVMVIDEAQLLSRNVLEQVRILTNLETTKNKLLQIILIGQPELNEILSRPDLRQLSQRITARYHLEPLSHSDTAEYIAYRLAVAGCKRRLFTRPAIRRIYRSSGGVPRLVNLICDRALLGAYAESKQIVDAGIAGRAAHEVLRGNRREHRIPWRWLIPGAAAAAAVLLIAASPGLWRSLIPTMGSSQQPAVARQAPMADSDLRAAVVASPVAGDTSAGEAAQAALSAGDSVDSAAVDDTVSESAQDPVPDQQLSYLEGQSTPADASPPPSAPAEVTETPQLSAAPVSEYLPIDPAQLDDFEPTPDETPIAELLRQAGPQTLRKALRDLGETWGVSIDARTIKDGCEKLLGAGLRCLKRLGSWNSLRSYNRPAVVTLSHDGTDFQVLIRAMDDRRVALRIGGATYLFPIGDVDALWFGEYLLLWRRPPVEALPISVSSEGADVLWLRQALNRALDRQPLLDASIPRFDMSLRQRVIEFQRLHNIPADGIVGVQTLIHLNTQLDTDGVPLIVRAATG